MYIAREDSPEYGDYLGQVEGMGREAPHTATI